MKAPEIVQFRSERHGGAHLNCLEMLPFAAAIGLAAVVSGESAVTDGLAIPFLYLWIGQSVVHLISTAVPFVLIRATLFTCQIVILLIWARGLLMG